MIEYLCSKAVASISIDEIKANDGITSMHCVTEIEHFHVVKSLIKNGFKMMSWNKKHQTPKILIQKNGYNIIVKILIETGDNENNANDSVIYSRDNKWRKIMYNFHIWLFRSNIRNLSLNRDFRDEIFIQECINLKSS